MHVQLFANSSHAAGMQDGHQPRENERGDNLTHKGSDFRCLRAPSHLGVHFQGSFQYFDLVNMSSIGRIVNSIFSGSNENTLALAAVNFDFSLVTIEAPKEFKPLGSAIAKTRRQDAEEGKPHQTARRLGALFEDVLPSFPKLVEAFGQRVSEIV
jgi:hypothetical protein